MKFCCFFIPKENIVVIKRIFVFLILLILYVLMGGLSLGVRVSFSLRGSARTEYMNKKCVNSINYHKVHYESVILRISSYLIAQSSFVFSER